MVEPPCTVKEELTCARIELALRHPPMECQNKTPISIVSASSEDAKVHSVCVNHSAKTGLRAMLGSPEPFMRFEHVVAMFDMSKRQQIKFARMSDIQRTCYLLDRVRRVEFQALSDYNPMRVVAGTNRLLEDTRKVVREGGDKAMKLIEDSQVIIESLKGVLGSVTAAVGDGVVGVLVKIIKVLVNFALAAPGLRLISLFFNLLAEFGSEIYAEVRKYFGVVSSDVVSVELQGFNLESLGSLTEFVGSNRTMCAAGLGSLIATTMMCALGLPKSKDTDAVIKYFGDRSRNLKGIFDLGRVAIPLFTAVGDYILNAACGGLAQDNELNDFLSGYNKWASEVFALMDNTKAPLAVRLEKDEKLVFLVDRLFKEGMAFAGLLNTKGLRSECTLHFHRTFKLVEEARRLCDYTGVFGNRPRMKPAVFLLFGESGVGKSGMAWPLACDLHCALSDTLEAAKEFSTEIYFRNTEQEFWDGYAGQNVVVYDDFGQRGDSQAAPNEEFMELIRAANLAPYPLHMASLEEKKRTKFCSKAIILTSNVLEQNVNSLTFPDAYRRRIDLCGKVINKEEYTKDGESLQTGKTVKRLDTSKCAGPVDTKPYLVQLYNAETQQPMCGDDGEIRTMDYEEFVMEALAIMKKSHKQSMAMNVALEERITPARFAKLHPIRFQGTPFEPEVEEEAFEDACSPMKWSEFCDIMRMRVKEQFSKYATLKSGLLLAVLALSGFGIWKWFSATPAKNTHHRVGTTVEACASGDNRTHVRKVLVTEAQVSGDSRTKKVQVVATEGDDVAVEAFASGDARTNRVARTRVEASSSGDNFTGKARSILMENAPQEVELEAWKDATAQDLISHRILGNLYKVLRRRDGNVTTVLNGLFVRDTIMLTPRHLLNYFRTTDEIILENIFGTIYEQPWSVVKIQEIEASNGYDKDAILLQFPRQVQAHTDIVKHFQTMPETSVRRVDVCLPTLRSVADKSIITILGNTRATMQCLQLSSGDVTLNIRDCIQYQLNTISGDCGAPVICNETSMCRKIAGIHIAGATDGSQAYAQSVTQADLNRALDKMSRVVKTDLDLLPNFAIRPVVLQMNTEIESSEILDLLQMPAPLFGFVGVCSRPPFAMNKTDIIPSVIHGVVNKPTTKPCVMYHRDVNIMNKNIAKCSVNTPYIPEGEVNQAVTEVKSLLLSGRDSRLARVLTFEEAIAGSEDSTFLGAINRGSSAGYPWVLERKGGTHGKTGWLGNDQTYIFDAEVRRAVMHRLNEAKGGVRIPVAWTATLKDERRPIEKVDALKTRVFANGPMDYTIAVRMYFLGFVAHVMENRIKNEQSLGTNPVGYDWTATAKVLSRFGQKVFAGDFSSFDGTLNSCILSQFVEVVNAFYDDGAENARIREVLMLDVYNSVWMCEGKYIALSHSQPSGNPLTTCLNSFYNSVSMRIAYRRCAKMAGVIAPPFGTVVSMVSYGDDNVINFSDSIVDWFNQLTVTEAYASFGMIYTDEAKSGELVAHRLLSEVAYLKRGFREVNGIYRAPMAIETLRETPNWIRSCPDHELACKMNVEDVCRELAQYEEAVFDRESQPLVRAFYEKTGIYPEVSTYATYLEEVDREMGLLV